MSTQRTVVLSHYVYTTVALAQTISDFQQFCSVSATSHEDTTRLEMTATQQATPDTDVISEFLNYLLASPPKNCSVKGTNMAREFYAIETYGGRPRSYELLPFKFIGLDAGREVLVNEVGEHLVVDRGTTNTIVKHQLDVTSELYKTLKARQFLYDKDSSPVLDLLATKYRTKKSFLEGFTKLHIFVVTLRCDHSCHYCQVSESSNA